MLDLDNFSDDIPLYKKIYNAIVEQIENGEISPGDKLPPERELSSNLNVARGTVKKAFMLLEKEKKIRTTQGSGSYVLISKEPLEVDKKSQGVEILTETLNKLKGFGLSDREIEVMFDMTCVSAKTSEVSKIVIIHDNIEGLLDFRKQLSYLKNVEITIMLFDTIMQSENIESNMLEYDVIIADSSFYKSVLKVMPIIKQKVVESAVAPSLNMLIELSKVDRNARVGVIARSNSFLEKVKSCLISLGFNKDNILSYFESEYTINTYFEGGIDLLVSFEEAHIFTDEKFAFRNEEFLADGKTLVKFVQKIERGTLIYIENNVSAVLNKKLKNNLHH